VSQQSTTPDCADGVTLAVFLQKGRPVGRVGQGTIHAAVVLWKRGLIKRITIYSDVSETRAASERLAREGD
jgi:hypothetical protein